MQPQQWWEASFTMSAAQGPIQQTPFADGPNDAFSGSGFGPEEMGSFASSGQHPVHSSSFAQPNMTEEERQFYRDNFNAMDTPRQTIHVTDTRIIEGYPAGWDDGDANFATQGDDLERTPESPVE